MELKFTRLINRKRPSARKVRGSGRLKRTVWEWGNDETLTEWGQELVGKCEFDYIKQDRVFCCRSTGSKTRAYARIWGLGRIWQKTLNVEPSYIIEIISEKFDKLPKNQQDMVLIHELLHIPKNFSGALVPHKRKGGVNDRVVREIYQKVNNNR